MGSADGGRGRAIRPGEASVPDYKYWAFISYSSRDTRVATRLHRRLETYRIPRSLVGRPGRDGEPVPRRLFPIFRDRDELPLSADLGASIEDALRASRYLVVVCSPHAAGSRWVNEEVRYFKSIGRADRILALIASGEPNAADSDSAQRECFPPALRYTVDGEGRLTDRRTEPVAGDLRRGGDGWTAGYLKAVAGITGLGYDAFARRERRRARVRRVAAGVVVAIVLGAALWFWDYSRLKVRYYADVVSRFGVPEGVVPLSDAVWTHRPISYRVESRRYRVREVIRVNGSGAPRDDPHNHGAARTAVVYREDGSVQQLRRYNHAGRLVLQESHSQLESHHADGLRAGTIKFESKGDFARPLEGEAGDLAVEDPDADQVQSRSQISALAIRYGTDGFPRTVSFRNANGAPVSDHQGVFGQQLDYDHRGLLRRVTNLDHLVQRLPDRRGVAALVHEYDSGGLRVRSSYVGLDAKPRLGPERYASILREFDGWGRCVAEHTVDVDGKLTLQTYGYATARRTYDDRGNDLEAAYFDVAGAPINNTAGIHKYVFSAYDSSGNALRAEHYDSEGHRAYCSAGDAGWQQTWDVHGNLIEHRYLGADGHPTLGADGTAGFAQAYDAQGNIVTEKRLAVNGGLTLCDEGFAMTQSTFDEQGNLAERAFFGTNGKLTLYKDGYARFTYEYDDRGNQVKASHFDTSGHLTLQSDGVAGWTARFDDHGNEVRKDYFGTDGEPIVSKNGYVAYMKQYDDRGRKVRIAYFGRDGKSMPDINGVAIWVSAFDDQGNETGRAYFGADGAPTLHRDGIARWAAGYDARGNEIERAYFGLDGQPATDKDGVASWRSRYDDRGKEIECTFFGIDGKPTLIRQGYATWRQEYDHRGNKMEVRYFDSRGDRTTNKDGIAGQRYAWDDRGLETEITNFDLDGTATTGAMGFATQTVVYDERRRMVRLAMLDADRKPIRFHDNKFAVVEYSYDDRGREI
jgi:hypothetical protein